MRAMNRYRSGGVRGCPRPAVGDRNCVPALTVRPVTVVLVAAHEDPTVAPASCSYRCLRIISRCQFSGSSVFRPGARVIVRVTAPWLARILRGQQLVLPKFLRESLRVRCHSPIYARLISGSSGSRSGKPSIDLRRGLTAGKAQFEHRRPSSREQDLALSNNF